MDYPKSVPSVGLVNGEFIDEDPAQGTPGSLIPSAWGNAVTKEILSVIQAAGLEPDETNVSQLAAALKWFAGGTATTLTATGALTKAQCGLVLANAAAGAIVLTLPTANAALGVVEVVLRRVDTTANTLTIAAAGTDKIMLDTVAVSAGLASTELLFAGDFLRLRSDGAGKWWCVGQAQLPPSLTAVFTKYSVTGVSTYTVPAVFRSGRRRARVTVTGAGGGGGHNETTTLNAGGGGGGGGRGTSTIDLQGISSVTITVGAGGPGASAGASAPGTSGGASSFGTYISSTGGTAGGVPTGGPSGTTTGDIAHPVSPAGAGNVYSLGHGGGYGGNGVGFNTQKGADGRGAGGGGVGGSGTSGNRGGGNGIAGEIIIEVA